MTNQLQNLGELINEGKSTDLLYDLGKGKEKTELLITLIDGESKAIARIESSPRVSLTSIVEGETSMDITDSNKGDKYCYKNLKPTGAVFEPSKHPPYELGDLAINLDGGKVLGISHYVRPE